jgi:hypothetical protein
MKDNLFNAEDQPFNLRGEPLDNKPSAEGEARARAEAEAEQRRAQRTFFNENDCGGVFDGNGVISDADSGL